MVGELQKPLGETVREMRRLAESVVPYSFPRVPRLEEIVISCLKQREIQVDGYEVVVHFNVADYGKYRLESLQVFGKWFTFLPLHLVFKIARAFLGAEGLSLVEVFYGRAFDVSCRRIYVWTVFYNNVGGRTLGPLRGKVEDAEVDGIKFYRVCEHNVNFF